MSIEMLEKPGLAEITQPPSILDVHQIMELIPHRYPFLLVDRVTAHEPRKWIQGYKNLSINEAFFQGHFPDNAVMPGVMIVEAMAQMGCILVALMPEGEGKMGLFAGIDNVRFRRPVLPGDTLELYAELTKFRGVVGKAYGKAMVNGQLAAEGDIMFSLIPKGTKVSAYGK